MDRLDAMRLFVRVAELGSFSAAAQQLGLARSVVTRQIVALESHLGVTLMVRTTRRLTLTSAGTTYLERCRVILDLVDSAETDVADERRTARGHIRISLPLSYGLTRLAPLLLEFSRLYPELSLDMDYTDRRVKLVEEGLDLSIRVTGRLQPGDVARRIGGGRVLVLASLKFGLTDQILQHPVVLDLGTSQDCPAVGRFVGTDLGQHFREFSEFILVNFRCVMLVSSRKEFFIALVRIVDRIVQVLEVVKGDDRHLILMRLCACDTRPGKEDRADEEFVDFHLLRAGKLTKTKPRFR